MDNQNKDTTFDKSVYIDRTCSSQKSKQKFSVYFNLKTYLKGTLILNFDK